MHTDAGTERELRTQNAVRQEAEADDEVTERERGQADVDEVLRRVDRLELLPANNRGREVSRE